MNNVNCEICSKHPEPVPYIVHESAMSRMERTIKRLWVLLIVLVAVLVGSNALWIWYESQMEVVERTEIEMENESGYVNYIGNDGDIYNGETESNEDKKADP